jgi:hypothetical protein
MNILGSKWFTVTAIGDRCFYIFSNQTSDIIKDKINKAFGV